MKPRPEMQRRQAHYERKQLARALHWANYSRVGWQQVRFRLAKGFSAMAPLPNVPKSLRKHRRVLINALLRA